MRTILPTKIIADFETFLETIGPEFRMDGNRSMPTKGDGRGNYIIDLDGDRAFEFHDAELAPPAGIMAENYCRYELYFFIKHTAHLFSVSFTAKRKLMNGLCPSQPRANSTLKFPSQKLVVIFTSLHMGFAFRPHRTHSLRGAHLTGTEQVFFVSTPSKKLCNITSGVYVL